MRWLGRRLEAAGWGSLVAGLAWSAYTVWTWFVTRPDFNDFRYFYIAADIGRRYGWSRIYDWQLQWQLLQSVSPKGLRLPFIYPPPVAWLALPFSLLAFRAADLAWSAGVTVAILAAAALYGRSHRERLLFALIGAAFTPTVVAIGSGQLAPFELLGMVGAARLLPRHPVWAAACLLPVVLKPHVLWLLLPGLLAGGYWRTAVWWAAGAAVLAIASVLTLGPAGVLQWYDLLRPWAQLGETPYTWAALLPIPAVVLLAAAAVVAVVVAIARLRRGPAAVEWTMSLIAAGSLVIANRLTISDFVLLLLPVWTAFRVFADVPTRLVWTLMYIAAAAVVAPPFAPALLLSELAMLAWMVWRVPTVTRSEFRQLPPRATSGS